MPDPAPPPLPPAPEIEAAIAAGIDRDRLRLLEIGYYISGVITIVTVSFLLFHFSLFLFIGIYSLFDGNEFAGHGHDEAPPALLFIGIAMVIGLIILLGWTFGALQIYAGRCLKKRCHRLFISIIAGLECIFMPWGTFLGVCTFVVMERPGVKALFEQG